MTIVREMCAFRAKRSEATGGGPGGGSRPGSKAGSARDRMRGNPIAPGQGQA
jgi:hypothetical protein